MRIDLKLLEILPKTIYFWLPVTAIFLGYGFMGRLLRIMTFAEVNNSQSLLLLALCVGSVWALSLGTGGLLATVLALGLVFKMGGMGSGLMALATAAVTIWLGFRQTDREQEQNTNISLTEIAALLVLMTWAVYVTLSIYEVLTGDTLNLVAGAIAGSYSVIGAQIKASGISNKQTWQFMGTIAGLGLAIGWIYTWFTYKIFIPS